MKKHIGKRGLALMLSVWMVMSLFTVCSFGALAEETEPESPQEQAVLALMEKIDLLIDRPVDFDSVGSLHALVNEGLALSEQYGTSALQEVSNLDILLTSCDQYNKLLRAILPGDVNDDQKVDAADALLVLQHSVKLIILKGVSLQAALLQGDDTVDASDALQILQYSVKLIDSLSVSAEEIRQQVLLQTERNRSLFDLTRESMFLRTRDSGYANTSINDVYPGMFVRDASIQILSHVICRDYEQARKILLYIFDYHITYPHDYALHVMDNNAPPISEGIQTDTTFFLLHAWAQYVIQAPNGDEKLAFVEKTLPQVQTFANYFFENGYLNEEMNLLRNPSLEHSRDTSYFNAYDLLTNVYASQALHELSEIFAAVDAEKAALWGGYADRIAQGIHDNLTATVDDLTVYAEMYSIDKTHGFTGVKTEEDFLYIGFSWVNLAPMGALWYAMDEEIMENTYNIYLNRGIATYHSKYKMLVCCTSYGNPRGYYDNTVIGKGLAWELMYCYNPGRIARVQEIISFIEKYSNDMYRETWTIYGGGGDTANQEHANWMILANQYVCGFIE